MITRLILKPNPWILVLQGIIMLAAGIFILSNPDVTLMALARLLGAVMLIAALLLVFSAVYRREKTNQLLLYEGIIDGALGLIFLLFPSLVTGIFIILLGFIAFISGLINLWLLIRARAKITSAAFLRNGLVLLFGILLLLRPVEGQEALGIIIGTFALIFGIISFYGAYKIWKD